MEECLKMSNVETLDHPVGGHGGDGGMVPSIIFIFYHSSSYPKVSSKTTSIAWRSLSQEYKTWGLNPCLLSTFLPPFFEHLCQYS